MSWTHLIETVKNTYNVQEQKPLVEKKESDQPKSTEQKSSQQVNNSKRVDVLVQEAMMPHLYDLNKHLKPKLKKQPVKKTEPAKKKGKPKKAR